ncbi:amino acid transporter [Streptomyces sp. WZ.A104]|uniref:Amino acid permease n=1 Tax=Streptomyces durocortorensis TaxID=2811104 RepID=A0ABY9W028_9ACTN|nr:MULTISPECIES: amino acid permease [Streptomyces]PCG81805.1 amino acid transporter [Streptomyces sp. WZ.A104]WNF28401.1 amino acid permease [Streptomyces durocortorensis]
MAAPAATRAPHPPQHPPAEHRLKPHLASRHLTMLALGGVIGAGLFVGSGQGLALAGPAVLVSYLLAALIALAIMRMLGELAAALPVSGSFSVYADKALGPWAGFTTGWLYWWITAIAIAVEAVAAAGIVHQWIPALPSWTAALLFMALFTALNTLSVKMFGEAEFWFASLKVAAIIAFIALGVAALAGWLPGTPSPGTAHLTGHGGFAPHGVTGIFAALLAVIFAFGGMEVIAMAAAESANPSLAVSRAVRSAIWRIALFYIGSVAVLAALLPWTSARPGHSPYPQALERLGIPAAGTVTEAVVLIALLSALNANLYGTSRMLHSLALRDDAPAALAPVSPKGSPRRAVVASAAIGFLCIPLEAARPGGVLPVLAEAMGGAMLFMWLTVAVSHLVLRRRLERTQPDLLVLRTPGFPGVTIAVIAVLVAVIAAMAFDPSARGQILASALLACVLAGVGRLRRRG